VKIDKRLTEIIEPYLEERGLRLYKLNINDNGKSGIVQVFVDGTGRQVHVEELTELNRYLGDILDAEDMVNNSYILEVSSPGLAVLENNRDFEFFHDRFCRVVHKNGEVKGYIRKVQNDEVTIEDKEGKKHIIKLENILKAVLDIDK